MNRCLIRWSTRVNLPAISDVSRVNILILGASALRSTIHPPACLSLLLRDPWYIFTPQFACLCGPRSRPHPGVGMVFAFTAVGMFFR